MPPFIYPTPEPTDSPSSRDESSKRGLKNCNDTTAPHSREAKRQRVSVQSGTLCFPPSYYTGKRGRQAGSDREAINALATVWNSQDRSQHEHNIWYLNDYSIYRKGTNHSVNDQLLDEPIFGETNTKQLKAIKMGNIAYKNTIVTPFVSTSST